MCIAFLGTLDHNTKHRRCDFLIYRSDGTAVRLHPESTKHGTPVVGDPAFWLDVQDSEAAPASTRGTVGMSHDPSGVFRGIHQIDTTSPAQACAFLTGSLDTWNDMDHPRPQFYTDLFEGEDFRWDMYLQSSPWGRDLCPWVVEFHLCWLNTVQRPGFAVVTKDAAGNIISGFIDPLGSAKCPYHVEKTPVVSNA